MVWTRCDVAALDEALTAGAEASNELDAKTKAAIGYLAPLRAQLAMLHLISPQRRYAAASAVVEHLHCCEACREKLRESTVQGIVATAARTTASCANSTPTDVYVAAEHRRRAETIRSLRKLRFVPQVRSGEIYLAELALLRLDELVIAQARAVGTANLLHELNSYVAESGMSFGDTSIVRAGCFMDPLIGPANNTAPLGLVYRVVFRARTEAPLGWHPPPEPCDLATFKTTSLLYARVLAPQYPSQWAIMRPSVEQVLEILERARMLDVVYGIHQHHPSALWPLLLEAYGPEVPTPIIDATRRVSDDLMARAHAREWDVDAPAYEASLNPSERQEFGRLLDRSRSWTTRDTAQFPVMLVDGERAILPTPPLLCGTLFATVAEWFEPFAAKKQVLAQRLEDFVLRVLDGLGARTISGAWRTAEDGGDIDAGFETEKSVVIFECKKSCQGFWGRVAGGEHVLDHFISKVARGVLQGLRLRNALQSSDVLVLSVDGVERELGLGGREFFHFVLTSSEDGAFQCKLFLHAILIGMFGASVTFSTPEHADSRTRRDWREREESANKILTKLTRQIELALPRFENRIDVLFRNMNAMPLTQLTFAVATLNSVAALEDCLRGTAAVQNSLVGPHEDFYYGYRCARGELSHNEESLLTWTSANHSLWVR